MERKWALEVLLSRNPTGVFTNSSRAWENVMNKQYAMLTGTALGAGLMYLLDPRKGRRAYTKDKITHFAKEADRIRALIDSYGLPTEMPGGISTDRIIAPMMRDKKAVAGELKFILPEKIGRVKIAGIAGVEKIIESLGLR